MQLSKKKQTWFRAATFSRSGISEDLNPKKAGGQQWNWSMYPFNMMIRIHWSDESWRNGGCFCPWSIPPEVLAINWKLLWDCFELRGHWHTGWTSDTQTFVVCMMSYAYSSGDLWGPSDHVRELNLVSHFPGYVPCFHKSDWPLSAGEATPMIARKLPKEFLVHVRFMVMSKTFIN